MGQVHGLPKDVCLDDFLNDLTALYPGIEDQIEDAYRACTSSTGKKSGISYRETEPILRHFIYQMGLAEILPRVCDDRGHLNMSEIDPLLRAAGVRLDTSKRLNCDDWKILVVAWVRRLEQVQASDLERWHGHLNEMQKHQFEKYHKALKHFEVTYLSQIEAYHKAVETEHKKEEDYRRQWEENQELQERFYESQQNYLAEMNRLAEENFAGRTIRQQQLEFVDKVRVEAAKLNQVPLEGAQKCFSFIYPAELNSAGAPISGGAMVPSTRPRLRRR